MRQTLSPKTSTESQVPDRPLTDLARPRDRGIRPGKALGKVLQYGLLSLGAVVMLVPLIWLLSASFKDIGEIFVFPPQWIPSPWRPDNYAQVFEQMPFLQYYWNTIIVTGLALIGQVASASLVGYGFARLRFPGRSALFLVLLATIMIPYPVTLIPTFVLFRYLGWLDTFAPLIVPYWLGGGAFFIFLLRQFYLRLSPELEDAARIDGAGTFTIFLRIALPQTRPALGVVAVFSFLGHWNDFLGPLIYLNSPSNYTLALGINLFRGFNTTQWNLLMAASVMATVPCVVLFAIAQRYFIQGIVFTGLK